MTTKSKSTAQPKKGRAESRDSASVHKGLTPKELRFIDEYMKDRNAAAAARRAGYSEGTARSKGQHLRAKVDISQEIERREQELHESNAEVPRMLADLGKSVIRRAMQNMDTEQPKIADALKAADMLIKLLGLENGAAFDKSDTRFEDLIWVEE
jgi:hypothetical protein